MVKCPAVQNVISVIGAAPIDMMDTMSKVITQGHHLGVKRYQVRSLVHGLLLAEERALSMHGAGMGPSS